MDFNANFNQFIEGLSTFLIGAVVVFVTLVLLIFIITLISKMVSSMESKDKKAETKIEVQPVEMSMQSVDLKQKDELELIAVITAVIAASMGTTADKLQVKSFRKVERRAR